MKKEPRAQILLPEPDEALLGYLQSLLNEVPAPEAPESELETHGLTCSTEKQAESVGADATIRPATRDSLQRVRHTRLAGEDDGGLKGEDDRPEWAESSFQSLAFRAAGRDFSLPLVCMKRIVRMDKPLTCLPGLPVWHLGILGLRGEKVGVIDLSRFLPGGESAQHIRNEYVLILDDGRWGLACEQLGQAVRLDIQDVRWRKAGGKPRFVAGVVEKNLTPLLSSRDIQYVVNKEATPLRGVPQDGRRTPQRPGCDGRPR